MCNKCETFHSKLFQNHNLININKYTTDIFSGLCKEEKLKLDLEFYCKNHKMLYLKLKKMNLVNIKIVMFVLLKI